MNKRKVGAEYETLAATFLMNQGYVILEKNFYSRFGEIDLIARDGRTLVFAEVKYRRTNRYGYPEEAVTARKQRAMIQTARIFMHKHGFDRSNVPVRFDVVCINEQGVRIIKDAFWFG